MILVLERWDTNAASLTDNERAILTPILEGMGGNPRDFDSIAATGRQFFISEVSAKLKKQLLEIDFSSTIEGTFTLGEDTPKSWRDVFKTYPKELSIEQRGRAAQSLLNSAWERSVATTSEGPTVRLGDIDLMKAYANGVGPVMRKLMQKMVETLPASEQELKEGIRTALQSTKEELSQAQIDRLKKDLFPDIAPTKIGVEPLGSASVGQVVRVTDQKREKFLPSKSYAMASGKMFPGISKPLERLLKETGNDADIPRFQDLAEGISQRLISIMSGKKYAMGIKPHNGKSSQIKSISSHPRDRRLNPELKRKYLPMTEAPGEPLAKVLNDISMGQLENVDIQKIADAMAEMRKLWTLEAFARGGFYHGDPHPGNFHIDYKGRDKATLTVLDYGNSGRMRGELRKATTQLGVGFARQNADDLLAATRLAVKPDSLKKLPEFNTAIRASRANEMWQVVRTNWTSICIRRFLRAVRSS